MSDLSNLVAQAMRERPTTVRRAPKPSPPPRAAIGPRLRIHVETDPSTLEGLIALTIQAGAARFQLSRQMTVVALALAAGASDAEIALQLGVSPNTAHYHVRRIFERTGAFCRSSAVARLMAAGTSTGPDLIRRVVS